MGWGGLGAGRLRPRTAPGPAEVQTRRDTPGKSGARGSGAVRGTAASRSPFGKGPAFPAAGTGVGMEGETGESPMQMTSPSSSALGKPFPPPGGERARKLNPGARTCVSALARPGGPSCCLSEKLTASRCQASLLDRRGTLLLEFVSFGVSVRAEVRLVLTGQLLPAWCADSFSSIAQGMRLV